MKHHYSITKEASFIRVHTAGAFDFVGIFEMWEAIIAACNSYSCFRVLGLSNLEGPPTQIDSYEYLNMLRSVGLTPRHRVAWVAENPALLDMMMLAETAIKNRSDFVVRIFESEAGAEKWIDASD